MHMSELLASEINSYRERTGRDALALLETGSIRGTGEQYHQNDGWSTIAFAEQVRDHGGEFYSIDINIQAADTVLSERGLRDEVNLIEGYSVDVLAGFLAGDKGCPQLDVALLDSDNDGQLILHEYMLAQHMVRSGGLILVDDVDLDSTGVVKGHLLAPWLRDKGIDYRIERRTGDGYATGVMVMEMP